MPMCKVVTDSTADLSPELIERYQLTVVPLEVHFDEESYRDGIDIDSQRLFQMVSERKHLPKTASPGPAVFRDAFEKAAADGSEVLYVGLSSKLSSTFQHAQQAAAMLPPGCVTLFDSYNLSTGIGLQVLLACELAEQGRSASEIVAELEASRDKVRTCFKIETLEYLHKGGRCSGTAALVSLLLRIRPIISVEDGGMTVAAKVRGNRAKSLDWMLERFEQDARAGRVRPDRLFITHADAAEDAEYMKDAVRRIMPDLKEILETQAGCVISSHCGPGTVGILYMQN